MFFTDADYLHYLELARECFAEVERPGMGTQSPQNVVDNGVAVLRIGSTPS